MNDELIKLSDHCCGCSCCANVCPKKAIYFTLDEKGFLTPRVDEKKCINCGLCYSACAFKKRLENGIENNKEYAMTYAVMKKRGRMQSQSGGAFSAFAETILDMEGIVYGVGLFEDKAKYIRVDHFNDISVLKKSKYVQASLNNIFQQVEKDLKLNRIVLFYGTACYVDGLKKYLEMKKAECSQLLLIDFDCAGVASSGLFHDYYKLLKEKFGNIKNFIFRYKTIYGWRECAYELIHSRNRAYVSQNWMNIAFSGYSLRESCYECPYVNVNRVSDITVADFWGIEGIAPKYDDGNGLSYVLIHSEIGKKVFDLSKHRMKYYEMDTKKCVRNHMRVGQRKPNDYSLFWKSYFQEGFVVAVTRFCGFNMDDYHNPVTLWIKNIKMKVKSNFKMK